jgi:hypothetical protein
MAGHEDYLPPVGFAREPAVERLRWFKRIVLALFIVGLFWLFVTGVISPPDDNPQVPTTPTELPGPL